MKIINDKRSNELDYMEINNISSSKYMIKIVKKQITAWEETFPMHKGVKIQADTPQNGYPNIYKMFQFHSS